MEYRNCIGRTVSLFAIIVIGGLLTFQPNAVGGGKGKGPKGKIPTPVGMTGQTTVYETGDDGDLQMGVEWPDPRFTDNEDGTVTDNLTGLEWTIDARLFDSGTWSQALSDCSDCTEGGFNDWRLPNIRELLSLIDYGNYWPPLPAGNPFIDVQPNGAYWSSSTRAANPNYAWVVFFYGGNTNYGEKGSGNLWVWCVRGGQ